MSDDVGNPLSTTQTYRGILHVTPYGWLDDTVGKMWMLIYRCGTTFEISIAMSDIEGTPFAAKLAPYMIEPRNLKEQIEHLKKSNDKNNLIIDHLFETLDELAPPKKREWATLEDVLRTPTYYLSLHRPDDTGRDAIARVDLGPIIKPALDILQAPFDIPTLSIEPGMLTAIKDIPASSVKFTSSISSSTIPETVVLPTGEVVPFLPAEGETENGDINLVSNPSRFAIRAYLRLQTLLPMHSMPTSTPVGVQRVLGVVTTGTPPPQADEHAQVGKDDTAQPHSQSTGYVQGGSNYLVGILLEPLPPGAMPIDDSAIITLVSSKPELVEDWYTSLKSTIQFWHSLTPPLYHGNINPGTILVCPSATDETGSQSTSEKSGRKLGICLNGFSDNRNDDKFVPKQTAFTPQGDLDALENIFGASGWLAVEIKKKVGEVTEDF